MDPPSGTELRILQYGPSPRVALFLLSLLSLGARERYIGVLEQFGHYDELHRLERGHGGKAAAPLHRGHFNSAGLGRFNRLPDRRGLEPGTGGSPRV